MTLPDLAAIAKRADEATAAPWECDVPNTTFVAARASDRVYEYICRVEPGEFSTDERTREENEANARFIAHARTDIPALLAEVSRLTAALADAYEACAKVNDEWAKPAVLHLHAGEMTAQETRSCIAVLKGAASAIRALGVQVRGAK